MTCRPGVITRNASNENRLHDQQDFSKTRVMIRPHPRIGKCLGMHQAEASPYPGSMAAQVSLCLALRARPYRGCCYGGDSAATRGVSRPSHVATATTAMVNMARQRTNR